MPASTDATFAPVARQVARRVAWRRGLGWLATSLWWIVAAVAISSLLAILTGRSVFVISTWTLVTGWLALAAFHAFGRKPGLYSVLSLWDQKAGRREAFASAWWFEQQSDLTVAQRAHIDAQQALLPEAQKSLAKDLPLQPHRWLWLPLALAVAALFVSAIVHPAPETLTLDEKMGQKARQEAQKLAETDWQKKNLEGLSTEEKAALEKLKESLKQTAEDLENAGGKDARDVMSDLEKRAREAEKLAERLAADKDNWASDKLVQSLREHADTADLGDAVAAKNSTQTAKAADALAEQLKSPQLTNDARERVNETLKDNEKNAEKEDRARTVGQHILAAAAEMQKTKPAEAGAEFQKLAEKMRDQARREQAQKELEKLAQQLRDAGSNITGQNEAGSMQQMAAASQQGQQGQQQQQQGQTPQVGQSQAQQQQQGQQQLQPPGLGQTGQGQQQQMMQQSPVPGTGQQQRMMMSQQPPGQQGQPKGGQPMLFAPIPGQKPGEKPDSFMLGPPGDNPGEGPPMLLSMPGGKDPGVGTAELNADATAQQKAGNQSVVAAQQNNDGASSVRSVEGGARKENSSRSASQIATEAITAEEEALDEAALPPSRREQVRRYFTELRKRFEKP
ncbi:MAG: hypothetical protein V4662_05335 [Verrucomicrobiota bacterium]